MTDAQRRILIAALNSTEIQTILRRLNLTVTEADVELAPGYPHVFQLRSRAHQVTSGERSFSEAICARQDEHVLLLGNTPAIEGFVLHAKHAFQLKAAGEDRADPPPGGFVQAFLTAWQNTQGWRDVWLYISAPRITTAFARQRWNNAGTQPRLEPHHLNGQISRVTVYCADAVIELPLALAARR